VVVLALVLLATAGCNGSLLKDAAEQSHDLTGLEHSRWTPPRLRRLPVALLPTGAAVREHSASLAHDLDGIDSDDTYEVIDAVCEVLELQAVQEDPSKADAYVEEKLGGSIGNRAKVEEFVNDMASANSSTDQAWVLGKAALCEAASQHE
jgi:hypothetical protein